MNKLYTGTTKQIHYLYYKTCLIKCLENKSKVFWAMPTFKNLTGHCSY